MKEQLVSTCEVAFWHDSLAESTDAKNVLDIFSIPYAEVFSEPGANMYVPFLFIGNNYYKIKGLEEIKSFAIDEVKKNKPIFYSLIEYNNDYINSANDLWMLESLFGEEKFIEELFIYKKKISNSFIMSLFNSSQLKFYVDEVNTIISTTNSELMKTHFGELKEITNIKEYIDKFSIQQLEEAKEKGYAKIK